MERTQKLIYDVGVNVVANLIAGGVIYLLGAWFGLFPRNPAAIVLSAGGVLFAVSFGTLPLAGMLTDGRRLMLICGLCLLGIGLAVVAGFVWAVGELPWWASYPLLVLAVMPIGLGASLVLDWRRSRRRGAAEPAP